MQYLGWIGFVFLGLGLYLAGNKWRHAFLFSVAGELLWIAKSAYLRQWDLAATCVLFAVLAARSWWLWNFGDDMD